ncbi:hypothetical protein BGZ70_004625 [Mortierella alpina]|uniref:Extracellular membrane protein CFEM domain-containing protein n=1 Tax=Mortierella alpina TaxID=64518 RepID=A0A9P6M4R7_MORAP|nr:hypothetical protein BGZ70_004625 [Mortierella alpina]
MKLSLITSAALLFAVAAAQAQQQEFKKSDANDTQPQVNETQTQPAFEKEEGAIPILGPATPLACKLVTTILTGLCALANYDGCEETVAYTQCICAAQRDPKKVLTCAHSELTTLLTGYCTSRFV